MARTQILNRYLYKEILLTFMAVVLVLMLIFVSGMLVSLLGEVVRGHLQLGVVLQSLGLNIISNLVFVLPLSFYIAILLSFSRLYKDNEMVVMTACGISQGRILRTVLKLALVFAIGVGWLSLYLAPWAESQITVLTKQYQQKGDIEGLSSGRFKELTKGEGVVYVQEFDKEALKLHRVFMQYRLPENNAILSADGGYRLIKKDTGDRFLVLENGFRYDGPTKNGQTRVIEFEHHGVRIVDRPLGKIEFRQIAVPSVELYLRGRGVDHAELQWRISAVILCFILSMLAIPLSKTSPRQGRYSKLALALLIYIIYTNLLNVSRAWLNKETVSPWVGMWWVHVLILLFAIMLYVRWKPLLGKFWFGKK
jgi:lipopolysaccharide export system permease protein